MAFAAAHLLGGIIASGTTLFGSTHRLTVQDGTAGLGFPFRRLAHPFPQRVMNLLPDTLPTPRPEVVIDRAPGWQIMRQEFPGSAAAHHIKDPVQDFAARVLGGTTARFRGGDQGLQAIPFGIAQVSIVKSAIHSDSVRENLFKRALS